ARLELSIAPLLVRCIGERTRPRRRVPEPPEIKREPAMATTSATTTTQVQPYLFFEGRCEEALAHYKKALGADVPSVSGYKESADPQVAPPGGGDKVMHAQFRVGETVVFCSDGRAQGKPSFQGFALSIAVPDQKTADRYFKGLEEGGQVMM